MGAASFLIDGSAKLIALVDSSGGMNVVRSASDICWDLCSMSPPRHVVFSGDASSVMGAVEEDLDLLDTISLDGATSGVMETSVTGGSPIILCIVSQPDSSVALDWSAEDRTASDDWTEASDTADDGMKVGADTVS